MPRRLFAAVVLASVFATSALTEFPAFHAQYADNDYYAVQWTPESAFLPTVDNPGGVPNNGHPHVPHLPGNHPPKQTNASIFSILKESGEFSRLFKVINISDDIVSLLNDTSSNLTFFALPNHAIPKRPHHHRPRDLGLDPLRLDFSLVDLVSHVESIDIDDTGHPDFTRPSKDQVKKIVTTILSYHIIPDNLDLGSLLKNTTHPTSLSHVYGALNDEPLRLRIGSGLPLTRVNHYSTIVKPDIKAINGFIHVINRPLLPPPSIFQLTFLLQREFATFSSAVQRTGLTNAVDYKIVPDIGGKATSVEGSAVVTAFVPSNKAFAKLPRKLQTFLFSPFGERALKKLLQYHIVPDIALLTDWVLNATSDAVSQGINSEDLLLVDDWVWYEENSDVESMSRDDYSSGQQPRSPPHQLRQCFSPALEDHQGQVYSHGSSSHDTSAHPPPPPHSEHSGCYSSHEHHQPVAHWAYPHPPYCSGHQYSQSPPNDHKERAHMPLPFECPAAHPPPFDSPNGCPHFPPPSLNNQGSRQHHHSKSWPQSGPPSGHDAPPPPCTSGHNRHTPFECAPPFDFGHHYPHPPPPSSAYGAYPPPPHQAGHYSYSSPSHTFRHYGPYPHEFGWQHVPPQYSFNQYGPPPPLYYGGYSIPPSPPPSSPYYTWAHSPASPAHGPLPPRDNCSPHRPQSSIPKPTVVANFTLPTALEEHSLNVVVVRIPIKLPIPKRGKNIGHITKVIVNGQPIKGYDGVALNGALHTVDTLISPRHGKGKPDHKLPPYNEVNINDWETWEDWFHSWVEM